MLRAPLKCVSQFMDWSYRWRAACDSGCDDSELIALLDDFFRVMYQARVEFAVVGFDSRGMDNLYINYSKEQSLEWKYAVMQEAMIILQEFYRITTSGELARKYVHQYDDDKICPEFKERISWAQAELERTKTKEPPRESPGDGLFVPEKLFVWGGVRYEGLTENMMTVLRVLLEAFQKGHKEVPLDKFESMRFARFDDGFFKVFRKTKGGERFMHPVRNIIHGNGSYSLIPPEQKIPD